MHSIMLAAGARRSGGGGDPPVVTFRVASGVGSGGNSVQNVGPLNILNADVDTYLILAVTGYDGQELTGVSVTPDGGSEITGAVLYDQTSATMGISFGAIEVPQGTDLTNATVTLTFAVPVFTGPYLGIWSCPLNDLNSTTPVDSDSAAASSTSRTLNISTVSGGFIVAAGVLGGYPLANVDEWSGDEATISGNGDYVAAYQSARHTGASASGTADATNSNEVTLTFTASGNMRLSALSFR